LSAGAGVSEETSEISAAKDEKSEEVDSDEPVILDRHKELMAVYQDPVIIVFHTHTHTHIYIYIYMLPNSLFVTVRLCSDF
jgi:hypothetical protein